MLDYNDILERVDEYSLYCHYLGYEPIPENGVYISPIRDDDDIPSFGLFLNSYSTDREFLWKDMANGEKGDVFKLVKLMFRYQTLNEARLRVIRDLGLANPGVGEGSRIEHKDTPPHYSSEIRIKSRPFTKGELKYWADINVNQAVLDYYDTTAVSLYWLFREQVSPNFAKEYTFAYRIWDRYKIYKPFADKKDKFRNSFIESDVEGLVQLRIDSPLLVITKSMKDVMFLFSLGYNAVAPRSEHTMITEERLRELESHYKTIVTLFDNDGKHNASKYNYPELHIPLEVGYKDPTDVARFTSISRAKIIVDDLLKPYL